MQESKQSIQGVVFGWSGDARQHGKGGIWYRWKAGTARRFPEDVSSVMIVMPVDHDGIQAEMQKGVPCEWTVGHKNQCGAQWSLSGTQEKPTLSPSLHWVGAWHGWLQDGFLRSC
jgi:hypothetical protein